MPKVVVLSDGCKPTEDIYLMRAVSAHLHSRRNIQFQLITCKKQRPDTRLLGSDADFLVVFRTLPAEWIQYLEANKAERKLIYVLDDDLTAASKTPELPKQYRTRISQFAELYLDRLLGLVDRLVVTSEHLMRQYQNYQPVRLNPTLLRSPDLATDFNKGRLSIAYHATSSHKSDLDAIQQPLIQTLDRYPCSFESLIGKQTPYRLLEHPATKLKSPKSYSSFRRFQSLAQRNICLAPLFETPYNKGKSWIKFLDSAAVGAVGVYSNRAPYTEIVTHGVNGMLADDHHESWFNCLSYLLENPLEAQKMAENALQTAKNVGSFKHAYRFWAKQFSS